jgi:hypothetical protein
LPFASRFVLFSLGSAFQFLFKKWVGGRGRLDFDRECVEYVDSFGVLSF